MVTYFISKSQECLDTAKIDDLNLNSIHAFVEAGIKSGRIYANADKDPTRVLLENLQLITTEEKLKAAAILLFGKKPKKHFVTSYFKIGKFGTSDSDLKFQDIIEGNIFDMVESVMALLYQRYILPTISYDGIQRIEKPEYPEAAIREAVLNAIVHKDYTDSSIQMSVYDDKIILWNPGMLSKDLTIEKLQQKHPSRPRNKNIAEVFFKAGYIESWGRGIEKMTSTLKAEGQPAPYFEENSGGFQVTFYKELFSEDMVKALDFNERQVTAIKYLKLHFSMTSADYQKLNKIGKSVAATDIQELIDSSVFLKVGNGRATKYQLKL